MINEKHRENLTHVADFLRLDVRVDTASWYSAGAALVHRVLTYWPQTITEQSFTTSMQLPAVEQSLTKLNFNQKFFS